MPKSVKMLMMGLLVVIGMMAMGTGTAMAVTEAELAAYWAPQIYQDTNATYGYKADYITSFDYDGDWVANNNWDNLYNYDTPAYVYYKVQETSTHYFIEYDFFHARDDGPLSADQHENDLEGSLLVITKDGSTYGSFLLMETMAHNQWYQYTNNSSITTGLDNVDGGVLFNGSHPKVFIQANGQSPWGGHGVFAYDGSGAPGGDGIVYNYTGTAQTPTDGSGNYTRSYGYALKGIDEIWNRRYDTGGAGHTFESYGVFDGDNYTADSAKAPWMWDDSDDGAAFRGMNFTDPAHMVDTHLNGLGNFSHAYVNNRYYSHKIDVSAVTSLANRDPFGGKSDIYVKVQALGEKFTDDRLWKYNDATVNEKKYVNWGYDDASDGAQYSSPYHIVYIAVPHNTTITVEIMDSDDGGDDSMGTLTGTPAPGNTVTWTDATTSNSNAKVTGSVYALAE